MAISSPIQWCDGTVNPTMGCDGCELWRVLGMPRKEWVKICYSGIDVEFRGASWRRHLPPEQARNFHVISQHPGQVAEAARWSDLRGKVHGAVKTGATKKGEPKITPAKLWLGGMPRLIFVSDESDALSADVPFEFLRDEIIVNATSAYGLRHCWLWLTKQPARMAKFCEWLGEQGIKWPANIWAGTSVTTQLRMTRAKQLLNVGDDTTTRFVSVEPQWESITLGDVLPQLDWIIQGGESVRWGDGSKAHAFAVEWADAMREECRAAGVPYFLKQMGSHTTLGGERQVFEFTKTGKPKLTHGGDWQKWDERFRVRQFPKLSRPVVSRLMLRRLAVR